MGYTLERFFLLSPTITANRALALSQTTRARKVKIKFSADAGVVLTLPANWVMSYANFDDATKELTLLDAGAFELSAWFDGTNWNAELNGPDNT